MAGVIDSQGQWERCNECTEFVLIQTLHFLVPGQAPTHRDDATRGLDLCENCAAIYEFEGFAVEPPR